MDHFQDSQRGGGAGLGWVQPHGGLGVADAQLLLSWRFRCGGDDDLDLNLYFLGDDDLFLLYDRLRCWLWPTPSSEQGGHQACQQQGNKCTSSE